MQCACLLVREAASGSQVMDLQSPELDALALKLAAANRLAHTATVSIPCQ